MVSEDENLKQHRAPLMVMSHFDGFATESKATRGERDKSVEENTLIPHLLPVIFRESDLDLAVMAKSKDTPRTTSFAWLPPYLKNRKLIPS